MPPNKAFIVNRIGDFGFTLGMFPARVSCSTHSILESSLSVSAPRRSKPPLACSLPLHFCCLWVPPEKSAPAAPLRLASRCHGPVPTPVIGLSIHAATMVTAGVLHDRPACRFCMTTRPSPCMSSRSLAFSPRSSPLPSALTQKRHQESLRLLHRFRSSATCFLGVGLGAYSAGIFHLMTHAFFKALLFLGAGQRHSRPRWRTGTCVHMGGLRKIHAHHVRYVGRCQSSPSPVFPFLSGFFSKDAILSAAFEKSQWMFLGRGSHRRCPPPSMSFRAFFMAFFSDAIAAITTRMNLRSS